MKIKEIRELKTDELHAELDRLRRHLFDLRSQAVTEKLQDPGELTKGKRDVARIFTVLQERGRSGDEEARRYHKEAMATQRRGG